jgi:hypothetical protein
VCVGFVVKATNVNPATYDSTLLSQNGEKQVGCSVVGVASPAGRFTRLVCSLGVILFVKLPLQGFYYRAQALINKLGSSSALRADLFPCNKDLSLLQKTTTK